MQSALAEKTAELLETDKRISLMLDSFEVRYKKWDNETADLERRLEKEKNQAEAAHKRKVQIMEAKLTSLQENVDNLDSRLAQAAEEADFARKECDFARTECDINKHRLQEWDNYLSQLKDMNLNDL